MASRCVMLCALVLAGQVGTGAAQQVRVIHKPVIARLRGDSTRPRVLTRDEVTVEEVEQERASLEAETRNEGKPEAAVPKIVEGKLNGWYKRVPGGVLLEQPYARDDKRSVKQVLGDATVVRFAQVVIGA